MDDPTAHLQRTLDRLGGMPDRDMLSSSVFHHLETINRCGRIAEGVGRTAIGPLLKRVLLVKPLSTDRTYIEENMADLAYSDDERQAIDEAKQLASQRKARVAEEIREGADPWLTHVRHNERDILNPYVVGCYQDDEGKIRSIFGPRHFQSKRQIANTIFSGRTEDKEVNLLKGQFVQVDPVEVLKGAHWGALPEDLRKHFERGEILQTTGHDLYSPSILDTERIAKSDDPEIVMKLVDQKVKEASADKTYMLLYYSDYRGEDTGRTAVVMTTDNQGELEPLVVCIGDKEFVVEVKGCGTKIGGFKGMQSRTGRDIITGGAEAQQARTEFYRLEDDKREGAPKAAGSILFENPNETVFNPKTSESDIPYEQGYVIRLTPSTVRASYTGNEVYPDIEEPEFVHRILQIYTSQLTDHMFSIPPKILDRSSHTENILVWNNGEFTFTDYSDHVAFADKSFPHYEGHGGDMTPKKMLEYYLEMVREIPGYRKERDQQKFYAYLSDSLEAHGIAVTLEEGEEVEQVVGKIWKGGMAYQVYRGRKDGQYFPEGVFSQFIESFDPEFADNSVPRDSAEALVVSEAQAREDLAKVIDFYRANPQIVLAEGASVDDWDEAVRTASVTDLTSISGNIRHVQYESDNYEKLTEAERRWLRGETGYYGAFDYIMIGQFRNYFEHELDVLTAAQLGCPEDMKNELVEAEAQVKQRLEHLFHLANNDLAGLYKAVSTPDAAKAMLGFDFYGFKKTS